MCPWPILRALTNKAEAMKRSGNFKKDYQAHIGDADTIESAEPRVMEGNSDEISL
jgi:hypothetical protein